ncbi:M64 family metallopeptidase [Dyadobacter sp. CY261]|uniref:M64 family metallopeptidase n=1 Tax=Dyadobacter sp. CY261 TaxID=2907203 RepID=UPI001F1864B8|nr:M64 family metallopeptidase [Dyadobacter sp. CY261]MCF0070045.1 M64 family metallopeptidase [Dyadobacter sp. CY261]
MKKLIFTLCLLGRFTHAFAQHCQIDTLYKTGSLNNRINVVILGDGFTKEEMPKFVEEAKKFTDFFDPLSPTTIIGTISISSRFTVLRKKAA